MKYCLLRYTMYYKIIKVILYITFITMNVVLQAEENHTYRIILTNYYRKSM